MLAHNFNVLGQAKCARYVWVGGLIGVLFTGLVVVWTPLAWLALVAGGMAGVWAGIGMGLHGYYQERAIDARVEQGVPRVPWERVARVGLLSLIPYILLLTPFIAWIMFSSMMALSGDRFVTASGKVTVYYEPSVRRSAAREVGEYMDGVVQFYETEGLYAEDEADVQVGLARDESGYTVTMLVGHASQGNSGMLYFYDSVIIDLER